MAADKELDKLDRDILRLISVDASLSLADIAAQVGLTPTPCWKRIRRMEQEGIIQRRIAVLDAARIGLPVSVFVEVETADHSSEWLNRFADLPWATGREERPGDQVPTPVRSAVPDAVAVPAPATTTSSATTNEATADLRIVLPFHGGFRARPYNRIRFWRHTRDRAGSR